MERLSDPIARAQRPLAVYTVLVGLLCAAVWASGAWGKPYRTMFDVPIPPGRSIHVHVGKAQPWRTPDRYAYRSMTTAQTSTALRVEMWYRPRAVWPGRYIGSFNLPAWPLALIGGAAGLALVTLDVWSRRFRHP